MTRKRTVLTLCFLSFFASITVCIVANTAAGSDNSGRTVWFPKRVQAIAHRGANAFAPENTVPAFEKAVEFGADFVEIDVRQSKDGVNFILHDSTLDRTTSGQGNARSFDYAAIRELSAGKGWGERFESVKVPTLEEVCITVKEANEKYGRSTTFYVDCKDPIVPSMVETLKKYGFLESSVFYGSERLLLSIRKLEPNAKIMPSLSGLPGMIEIIEDIKPYAFDTSWKSLSKELIDKAHEKGVKIFSDAPGNATVEELHSVIEMGIDGIQTDHLFHLFQAENRVPKNPVK